MKYRKDILINRNQKKFLNNLEDFCYEYNGYYETLQSKINSSNAFILTLSMKTDSGKPKYGKQYGYDFFNEV